MICALDNKPEIREEIQNLADKIGYDYDTTRVIYENNNGYSLDKAPNGAESKLYKDLLEHYGGNETLALKAKAKTYLAPFFNWFGDWTVDDKTNVSKVVDENGEPLIVYHGTTNEFNEFDMGFRGATDPGDWGLGFYFSPRRDYSGMYGNIIIPSYINIKNPVPENLFKKIDAFGRDKAKRLPLYEKLTNDIKTREFTIEGLEEKLYGNNPEHAIYREEPSRSFILMNLKQEKLKLADLKSQLATKTNEELDLDLNAQWNSDVSTINKFDGVIPNISKPYESIELVVAKPNQIKSIDNDGNFSTENDDISATIQDMYFDQSQYDTDKKEYEKLKAVKPTYKHKDLAVRVVQELLAQFPKMIFKITPYGGGGYLVYALKPKKQDYMVTRNVVDTSKYFWNQNPGFESRELDNEDVSEDSSNDSLFNKPSDPTLKQRLFNGQNSVSIGTMLTRLRKDNPKHAAIINVLQKNLSAATKSWKIELTDFSFDPRVGNNQSGTAGLYFHKNHTIFINSQAQFRGKNGKADFSILHEIIHAATVDAVEKDPEVAKKVKSLLEHSRNQLSKKYRMSWQELIVKKPTVFYGLTDEKEFLSEIITSAAFIKEMSGIPAKNSKFKRVVDEFINWLSEFFKININDTAYGEAYAQLQDIIMNYLAYNETFNKNMSNYAPIDESVFSADIQRPSIQELVNKYKQLSDEIEFDEESHTYTNKNTGKTYKPVSEVKTEVGYGEQEDKLPESAVQLGNITAELGTLMHKALSDMLVGKFDKASHPKLSSKVIQQLNKMVSDIKKNYEIISSEQVLADDKTGIAGTADLIVANKKTGKIIILDFKTKIRNLGDQKKSGFSYYYSSKFGKPDVEKHNFQLTMYERLHNIYGFAIDERGIIPIEYDIDNDGNITNVYLTAQSKGTTLDSKGYFTLPHRSQIDQDINDYVFTSTSDGAMDKIQLEKQTEIVSKILDTLRNKVVNLYAKGRNTQATDIENTVNEFNSLSEQEIIVSYIKTALDSLKNIINGRRGYNEHLQRERTEGNIVWNLKLLENWRDVARSFKPLEEIQSYLFDYQDILPAGEYEEIMPILDEAIRYRDILEGAYKSKGKALWIEWIKPFIKNIEGAYRIKAEREYKKTHDTVDPVEMLAYVEKFVADNRTKIEIETKNFINQQSQNADSDVNGFYRWVDTIFQSKDPIVSGMALAYDEMVQQTNETFAVIYKKLVDLTREMELNFGSSVFSDPKSVYDYMLEKTEDGVKLIEEIPESFTKAYKKKIGEIDHDPQYKNGFERFKAKMEWLDNNAPIQNKQALKDAKIKAVEDYLNSIDVTEEEFNIILNNERKKGKQRKSYYELAKDGVISYKRADDLREISEKTAWKFRKVKPDLYPNEKYRELQKLRETNPTDIRVRFYDFIKQLSEDGDARVAPRYRLNGRLPGISKTSVERLAAGQSVLQVAKELASKTFQLKADDTMYGLFEMTDELNQPVNFIPVFFTNKLKEKDQSYDVPTLYKEWFKSALLYANTNEIIDQLEFTRFIVNDRKTKTGGISYASKVWKRLNPDSQISEAWSAKDSSNLANQLNDWFDLVVYGKGTDNMGSVDIPLVGKVDLGKAVDAFTKYTSLRVMGLNYISMVNNALMAEVAQAIETMAGKYVSASSYTKATAEYTLDLANILNDVGSRKPTSKTNLLNELFGTFMEYDNGRMRFSNKASKLFNSGAFYFTTNLGEHEAQSRFLIASLINTRALDSKGNDIGTIYDYYTVEDGVLVFDKDGKVANWTDETRRHFSSRVRSQLMSMHGNYSSDWKVALQRNGYLKLALMFRKWIIPSWRKRYDGLYYDNVMQDYKEGYYRTGFRFVRDNVKSFFYKLTDEAKAAEIAITADWHNLTEMEKQNVKRFSTEVAIFVSLCVLFSLLKKWADDDDNKFIDNLAYQAYRLRTDMGFYLNPRDMMKIVQSPFPSTSSVRSVYGLFDSILHPLDKYERGPWKDHYKIEKRIYDMMPVVRQLYRACDIENEYNILNMK